MVFILTLSLIIPNIILAALPCPVPGDYKRDKFNGESCFVCISSYWESVDKCNCCTGDYCIEGSNDNSDPIYIDCVLDIYDCRFRTSSCEYCLEGGWGNTPSCGWCTDTNRCKIGNRYRSLDGDCSDIRGNWIWDSMLECPSASTTTTTATTTNTPGGTTSPTSPPETVPTTTTTLQSNHCQDIGGYCVLKNLCYSEENRYCERSNSCTGTNECCCLPIEPSYFCNYCSDMNNEVLKWNPDFIPCEDDCCPAPCPPNTITHNVIYRNQCEKNYGNECSATEDDCVNYCGPTATSIALSWYGIYKDPIELDDVLYDPCEGSDYRLIAQKMTEESGKKFEFRGYIELNELERILEEDPVIIGMEVPRHVSVVSGKSDAYSGYIITEDPWFGPKIVKKKEIFFNEWRNIAVVNTGEPAPISTLDTNVIGSPVACSFQLSDESFTITTGEPISKTIIEKIPLNDPEIIIPTEREGEINIRSISIGENGAEVARKIVNIRMMSCEYIIGDFPENERFECEIGGCEQGTFTVKNLQGGPLNTELSENINGFSTISFKPDNEGIILARLDCLSPDRTIEERLEVDFH